LSPSLSLSAPPAGIVVAGDPAGPRGGAPVVGGAVRVVVGLVGADLLSPR
jgi:hypothetical protein